MTELTYKTVSINLEPIDEKSNDCLCGGGSADIETKSVSRRRQLRFIELETKLRTAKLRGMTHKVWKTIGGSSVRRGHMTANRQKVKINDPFIVGGQRLRVPCDPMASYRETANCRCDVEFVREQLIGSSGDDTLANISSQRYSIAGDVIIPAAVRDQLDQLANEFYRKTGKTFKITSGYRPPERQAIAMFNNRKRRGSPFTSFYRQFGPANELEKVYNDGIDNNLSSDKIIANLTNKLREQIAVGVFISDHLIERALDISFRGLSVENRLTFAELAMQHARKVLVEDNHFHIEF